jgi:predicted O-methyltransferase YrrM
MARSEPHFTSDWFSAHVPAWRSIFEAIQWNPSDRKTVIEIGAFEGRSSLWILENLLGHSESVLYCVDTFPDRDNPASYGARFDANINGSTHGSKARPFAGTSFAFLKDFVARGDQADFIYLDGSHQAVDVLEDLVFCFRALKPGGLLICDDYLGGSTGPDALLSSPKLAIDLFTTVYRRHIQIIPRQPLYQLAMLKTVERGEDDPTSRAP